MTKNLDITLAFKNYLSSRYRTDSHYRDVEPEWIVDKGKIILRAPKHRAFGQYGLHPHLRGTVKQLSLFGATPERYEIGSYFVTWAFALPTVAPFNLELYIRGGVVDVEVDGIDPADYPDFCDAFVAAAYWADTGEALTEEELDALNADCSFAQVHIPDDVLSYQYEPELYQDR